MFQIGQQVLYGSHGICTIVGLEEMRFGKVRSKYYALQPLEQPETRFYVPAGNDDVLSKLQPLMSREELLDLLHSDAVRRDVWIDDENQRKQRYRELITSGDRSALCSMIYCLYQHKSSQLKAGRKFHQCDERFLLDAQKLLNSEFALVFGLKPEQVNSFVAQQLGIHP